MEAVPVAGASFSVARLEYDIISPELPLLFDPDPAYLPFLPPFPAVDPGDRLEIHCAPGDPPDTGGLRLIFRAGETWSLYGDRDERLIVFHPPSDGGGPLWTARFSPGAGHTDLKGHQRLLGIRGGTRFLNNPVHYPLDQLLLIQALGDRGVLLHAAGATAGGRSVALAGKSGSGKSTISRLLHEHGGFQIQSDDRVVIRRRGRAILSHGTPWPGDAGFAADLESALAALCFLSQGDGNRIRELGPRETLASLLPVASIPWHDPGPMDKALSFCRELILSVPAYEFTFRPDPSAAEELLAFLAG